MLLFLFPVLGFLFRKPVMLFSCMYVCVSGMRVCVCVYMCVSLRYSHRGNSSRSVLWCFHPLRLGAEQDPLPWLGPQNPLLASVKRWKLACSGHVTCYDSLSRTNRQITMEGGWCCSLQRKWWMDNIKERTTLPMPELLTRTSCRKDWKKIWTDSSLMSPWQPSRSREWTELGWTPSISNLSGVSRYLYNELTFLCLLGEKILMMLYLLCWKNRCFPSLLGCSDLSGVVLLIFLEQLLVLMIVGNSLDRRLSSANSWAVENKAVLGRLLIHAFIMTC